MNYLAISEKQYLACVWKTRELMPIESENFLISKPARAIWDALVYLRAENVKWNRTHVMEQSLKSYSSINPDVFDEIENYEIEESNYPYYVSRIKEEFVKDQLKNHILKETMVAVGESGSFDVEAFEELARMMREKIGFLRGNNGIHTVSGPELQQAYEEILAERVSLSQCIPSGDSELDSFLYGRGFIPGTIAIIYGPSGVGKSIFALNLVNKQINKGIHSIYVSLEMGKEPTLDRLVALRTDIPIEDLVVPTEDQREHITERARRELEKLKRNTNFVMTDNPKMNIAELSNLIDKYKKEWGTNRIIVTVDLMTMLKDFSGDNKASVYEDAMNSLHEVVKQHRVALIGVVQARRPQDKVVVKTKEDLKKFKPTIEQLKNSSALEERARVVLGVFRAKHFGIRALPQNKEIQSMTDLMEVSILKNNMGRLGELKYLYVGEIAKLYKTEASPKTDASPDSLTPPLDSSTV